MSEADLIKQQLQELVQDNKTIKESLTTEINNLRQQLKTTTSDLAKLSAVHDQVAAELVKLVERHHGTQTELANLKQKYQQTSAAQATELANLKARQASKTDSDRLASAARKPKPFSGDQSQNIETWINEFQRYCTASGITTDASRLNLILVFLTDHASTYIDSVSADYGNYNQLVTLLKKRFQPVSSTKVARAQLKQLRQASWPVSQYCSRFLSLVNRIDDMADADKIEKFIDGLNFKIQSVVLMFEPTSLQDAMLYAQRAEANTSKFFTPKAQSHHTTDSRTTSQQTSTTNTTPASSTSTNTPMQVDRMYCTHCHMTNHNVDRCFKKNGHPRRGRVNAIAQQDADLQSNGSESA